MIPFKRLVPAAFAVLVAVGPARALDIWKQVMAAVNKAGPNEVSMLTTIVDDAAVAAVSAALTTEMEAEVKQMTEELATGLSERAMKRRSEQLTALVERLKDYETSLGTTLDTLRQSLVTLETGLIASAGGAEFGGGADHATGIGNEIRYHDDTASVQLTLSRLRARNIHALQN